MTSWRFVRDLAIVLGTVLGATLLVLRFLAVPWEVDGRSMMPTLQAGDRVVVDLWTYRNRGPTPGEIALFEGPGREPLVKRIAPGAPSGAPEESSDLEMAAAPPLEPRFWVTGDNPPESLDSRAFGPVPRSRFRGRIAWRYWPPSRVGRIR